MIFFGIWTLVHISSKCVCKMLFSCSSFDLMQICILSDKTLDIISTSQIKKKKKHHVLKRFRFTKEHTDSFKETWSNIYGLMGAGLLFLCPGTTDSLSDDPQTLSSSHRTLKTVSTVEKASWYRDDVRSIYHIPGSWINLNTDFYQRGNVLKWVFEQDNNPKHTRKQQHPGSRPTRLMLWSGQFNPWTLI